jgi:hypothetical protein
METITLTKKQKIEALGTYMTYSKREDGTGFHHFTDNAPEELKDLYLEHYEVRDIDYDTFSTALDIVSEIYGDKPEATEEEATDDLYERASDSASVYTADRLAYLDIWNEDEISELMREYGEHSIATACAIWYDRQVEQAGAIIIGWINA